MEYKHHWKIDQSTWYLKVYLWIWEADIHNVDFCRLFWGWLFTVIPIGPLLRVILIAFHFVTKIGAEKRVRSRLERAKRKVEREEREKKRHREEMNALMRRLVQEEEEERDPTKQKVLPPETSMQKILTKVENGVAKAIMQTTKVVEATTEAAEAHPRATRNGLLTLAGAVVVFLIYLLFSLVVVPFWSVVQFIVLAVGLLIAVLLLGIGIGNLSSAFGVTSWLETKFSKFIDKAEARNHTRRTKREEQPKKKRAPKEVPNLFQVIVHGAKAVKSNTCPKVEVIQPKPLCKKRSCIKELDKNVF